jgi:lysophospholipase L1-like esterase
MKELMMSHYFRLTRRNFVQAALAAGAAVTSGSATNRISADEPASAKLKPGSVVLFQGDSITDAGRNRNSAGANQAAALGSGYPFLIACELLRDRPDTQLKLFNRGISGNKVPDLQTRWQRDCIDLQPDVLSILIGVNDIWHKLNGNYDGTVQDYEDGYRNLLAETQTKLPATRIVICEPFVLKCGAVNERWFPEFDQRRAVAKQLAQELKLAFVPFQTMFDKATEEASPAYWAGDGVHPTLAGHALMAKAWREVTGI